MFLLKAITIWDAYLPYLHFYYKKVHYRAETFSKCSHIPTRRQREARRKVCKRQLEQLLASQMCTEAASVCSSPIFFNTRGGVPTDGPLNAVSQSSAANWAEIKLYAQIAFVCEDHLPGFSADCTQPLRWTALQTGKEQGLCAASRTT